jgi:hypothetical protein
LTIFFVSQFFKTYFISHKKTEPTLKIMRGVGVAEIFFHTWGERWERHDATGVAVVACRPNNGSGMREIMGFSLLFFLFNLNRIQSLLIYRDEVTCSQVI